MNGRKFDIDKFDIDNASVGVQVVAGRARVVPSRQLEAAGADTAALIQPALPHRTLDVGMACCSC